MTNQSSNGAACLICAERNVPFKRQLILSTFGNMPHIKHMVYIWSAFSHVLFYLAMSVRYKALNIDLIVI